MFRVDNKKYIFVRVCHFRKNGNSPGFISITYVIFTSIGEIRAVRLRVEFHVGRVDICPVFFFGKPECAKWILLKLCGCLMFCFFIVTEKYRIKTQCGNMVHVPVRAAVKT